jgi:hypothetical protein
VHVATDIFGELRSEIRSAALDHTVGPTDRHARLTALRRPLMDALGELDRYRADAQNVREAQAGEHAEEVAWARSNASIRDELIEAGEMTAEDADAMGMLSHAELDRLQEEGLLEEAVASLALHWEEALHPRNHGQFASKPGAGAAPHAPHVPDAPAPAAPKATKATRDAQAAEHQAKQDAMKADHEERTLGALSDYVATKAEAAEREVTPSLQKAVSENGGELQGLEHRLKSRASIQSKIRRKRDTMPLATDEERAQSVTDSVRYTAVFDTNSYVAGVERALSGLEKQGYKAVEKENYWGGDDDYDGLHVGLQAPNGSRIELQFHTKDSLGVKSEKNHPIYERFRSSKDPHERWDLWQQMVQNTAAIPQPKGVAELAPPIVKPAGKRPVQPGA